MKRPSYTEMAFKKSQPCRASPQEFIYPERAVSEGLARGSSHALM
ncbi:MAG: hypothetical protein WCQ57_16985 [Verrucomicrobiota bacterium]